MDRRSFAVLLPALLTAPTLLADAQTPPAAAAPAGALPRLQSDDFPAFTPPSHFEGHASKRFFLGMLPGSDGDNIRFESHITYLEPGAKHEPVEKHKHSEMWLVREGTVELNLNGVSHTLRAGQVGLCVAGDMHYVRNAGTDQASYFVISIGPPE